MQIQIQIQIRMRTRPRGKAYMVDGCARVVPVSFHFCWAPLQIPNNSLCHTLRPTIRRAPFETLFLGSAMTKWANKRPRLSLWLRLTLGLSAETDRLDRRLIEIKKFNLAKRAKVLLHLRWSAVWSGVALSCSYRVESAWECGRAAGKMQERLG